MRNAVICLLLATLMSACSTAPFDETADWDVAQFYQAAKDAMDIGDYETAVGHFSKLEARFPYGRYAEQAQLETAYAHYKAGAVDAAIAAAERFIKLHPRHENVDYAYFIRGLASYDDGTHFLDSIAPQDPAERDPKAAREAFNYFSELVQRFPDSQYRPKSIELMKDLRNRLARHEVKIADYYLRRGAYMAVVNRGKYVIEHYQNTPSVEKALALMVAAYLELDMLDLAEDNLKVLERNYPQNGDATALRVRLLRALQ